MDFVQLLQTQPLALAILLFVLFSGARRWWVYGATHKEITDDLRGQLQRCELEVTEWKAAALRGTILASDAVSTVETVSSRKARR